MKFLQLLKRSPFEEKLKEGLYHQCLKQISEGYTPTKRERSQLEQIIEKSILNLKIEVLQYAKGYVTPLAFIVLVKWAETIPEVKPALEYSLTQLDKSLEIIKNLNVAFDFKPQDAHRHPDLISQKFMLLRRYSIFTPGFIELLNFEQKRKCLRVLGALIEKFDKAYSPEDFNEESLKPIGKIYQLLKQQEDNLILYLNVKQSEKPVVNSSDFEVLIEKINTAANELLSCDNVSSEQKYQIKDKVTQIVPQLIESYHSIAEDKKNVICNGATAIELTREGLEKLYEEICELLEQSHAGNMKNIHLNVKSLKIGR